MSPHHRLQTYYGYAFESWCTSDIPEPKPAGQHTLPSNANSQPSTATPPTPPPPQGWGGDVDTNVQWCSVVKTKLGGTRIVLGGEVDCVRGQCSPVLLCCSLVSEPRSVFIVAFHSYTLVDFHSIVAGHFVYQVLKLVSNHIASYSSLVNSQMLTLPPHRSIYRPNR
jgi:hypothetical protein